MWRAMWALVLVQLAQHHRFVVPDVVATETKPIPDIELTPIDVSATLLWGRHDRMVPLAVGEAAAARHGWPLRIIDHAAHASHIEQPGALVEALTAITASA